jgi:hypothetical protein
MPRLSACVLAFALVEVCGCNEPLGDSECDSLLDHYTERLLLEERPRISNAEVKRKQDEARQLAKGTERFEYRRCPELVSRAEFECAMNASSVDHIERCLM